MKTLLITILLAATTPLFTGCATPAYSGGFPTIRFPEERHSGEVANNIVRNWAIENRMMVEDINMILLLEPVTRLSKWNIR